MKNFLAEVSQPFIYRHYAKIIKNHPTRQGKNGFCRGGNVFEKVPSTFLNGAFYNMLLFRET
jgi:hypothetical protein